MSKSSRQVNCEHCGEIFNPYSSSKARFCSTACQAKSRSEKVVRDWLDGKISAIHRGGQLRRAIKQHIKERDEYKCCVCGWGEVNEVSGHIPVEVDHIDGDHKNNNIDNLRTLCPNCHSLTPTWKNTGNRGMSKRGREHRRI